MVTAGIMPGLIGMFFGLLSDATVGGVVGFGVGLGAGAVVYLAGALAGRIFKGLPFLSALLTGGLPGAVYRVGVAVRSNRSREGLMSENALAEAALFLVPWFCWRHLTKPR